MSNSKDKGNIGEAKFLSRLIELGKEVAIPYGDNTPYDLLFKDKEGDRFYRVQVKYATMNDGAIPVRNSRVISNKGRLQKIKPYAPEEVDYIGAYCPETDGCYLIPIGKLKEGINHLRVVPAKNNQKSKVREAGDYKL